MAEIIALNQVRLKKKETASFRKEHSLFYQIDIVFYLP